MMTTANYIHVEDVAILHIAGLLDPEVEGQRFPAWNTDYNWNGILPLFRKLRPTRKFIDDVDGMQKMQVDTNCNDSKKLMQKWTGRKEWIPLETAIEEMVVYLEKLE